MALPALSAGQRVILQSISRASQTVIVSPALVLPALGWVALSSAQAIASEVDAVVTGGTARYVVRTLPASV